MSEWNIIWEARGAFLNGALNTLILFVLSVLAAFAIGCFSVYLLEGRNWLSTLLRGAINLMRMLPFLVLAYLLYYGLPALGVKPSAWGAGLVALAIYHAAYFAEILRGARLVLPLGQVEAAKAHGFRPARPRRRHHFAVDLLIVRYRDAQSWQAQSRTLPTGAATGTDKQIGRAHAASDSRRANPLKPPFFRWISNREMLAGVMPEIRDA